MSKLERLAVFENQDAQHFYDSSFLKLLFSDLGELDTFIHVLTDVADTFPEIKGILLTGTMVQQICLPNPRDMHPSPRSSFEAAYRKVANLGRRKIAPHPGSDIDIWLLTDSDLDFDDTTETISERSLDVLDWLSKHMYLHADEQWIQKKREAFGEFYKKAEFYSGTMLGENPWMATSFIDQLVKSGHRYMPGLVAKLNYFFSRGWNQEIFEVRAYPEAVFNIRPETVTSANGVKLDRSPMAYYLPDWLNLASNTLVIAKSNDLLIEPFKKGGIALGQEIQEKIESEANGFTD